MGEEMEGKKMGEIKLVVKLNDVDDLQARLDVASTHIRLAREILDSLADGVEIEADLIGSDTTSRSGDSASILEEEE